MLIATFTSLIEWDPRGQTKTTRTDLRETLYGANSKIRGVLGGSLFGSDGEGKEREWSPRVAFTLDGTHVFYSNLSEVPGISRRRTLFGVLIRTDSAAEESTITQVLNVEAPLAYEFTVGLSPTATHITLAKEGQLEVFALGSGRPIAHIARRTGPSSGSPVFSLNGDTVFVAQPSPPHTIEALQLSTARSTRSAPLPSAVFSPDRTHAAALNAQGRPLIWDASTGKVRTFAAAPKCEYCDLSWRGPQGLVLVDKRLRKRQITIDLESGNSTEGAYEPYPVYEGEGFRAFEEFTDDNKVNPTNVYVTTPRGANVKLTSLSKNYLATRGLLLVHGGELELIDADGTRQVLTKR